MWGIYYFSQEAAMPAYVIAELEITDPAGFDEYRKGVPATIAAYGGRYLARGGALESLEGGWAPKRMVVLEFPSADRAREWWNSALYAPAKRLRHEVATTQMILVEGL